MLLTYNGIDRVGFSSYDATDLSDRLNQLGSPQPATQIEFNVKCYNHAPAKTLNKIVDRKVQGSREITSEEVNRRSFPELLRDGLARLPSPYL